MARPKSTTYKKWTEEEKQYLEYNYFIVDVDILAKHFDRTAQAVKNKYLHMNKAKPIKKRKQKVKLINCPNCKNEINRVEMGYFCKYCLKEYDNYGDLIAPLL